MGKSDSNRNIAVIAGGGNLPLLIIEKLSKLRRDFAVLSIDGFGPSGYRKFELGSIGKMLAYIKNFKATEVVFCGNVKRPSFFSLKLDSVGKRWLAVLGIRAFLGDNALLSGIKKLLEREGIKIIGPQSILSTLLTPPGILTANRKPSETDLQDMARGIFVLNTLSNADVGQAVIVQEGVVLGVEAAEGTAELVSRCKHLKLRERGGVLVKTSKRDQDKVVDLPSIGKWTISDVSNCGLNGIAIGAGDSQIIDYEETIAAANSSGIFVLGFKSSSINPT
ncbi:MAG: UDP-2,3-diacylglucosamine diphosphatase LpxI [Holosporales bacterium]|nr:UDP-2,3-diacylglucosamine diphosphatase LpxI [Holosporales bacterium]